MSLSLEEERQRNILANKELLKSLDLNEGGKAKPAKAASPKPRAKPRAPRKKPDPDESTGPSRRSSRLTTALQSAVDPIEQEALKKRQRELEAEEDRKLREIKRARHNDRILDAVYRTGAQWRSDDEEALANQNLRILVANLPAGQVEDVVQAIKEEIKEESPRKKTKGGRSSAKSSPAKPKADPEVADLAKTMSALVMNRTERVVPERVYSLAVHPTVDKELVFLGDKGGHLGFCDVAAELVVDADDDEDGTSSRVTSSFAVKAHARSSVSAIRVAPHQPHTLYTAAYDCTVRALNFETMQSVELLDAEAVTKQDFGENECLIGSFDITNDGHELWVCDNRGGIFHHDLRESRKSAKRWQSCEKKIGCISLNPANQNILVTAHLNRDMRVWDARKLVGLDENLSWQDVYREACVAEYTHGYACSSAYFDRSGTKILSTSYDDQLRVWNVDPSTLDETREAFEPDVVMKHDNQTGRYCTVFKAQWSRNPNEQILTVGNMRRGIDIFGADGSHLALLNDSQLTTVPAVTGSHPSLNSRIYGATASGKLYAWSPAKDES